MNTEAIIAVLGAAGALLTSKKFKKAAFGTYSDGTVRSFADAISGEVRSPADRDRKFSKKKQKKNR